MRDSGSRGRGRADRADRRICAPHGLFERVLAIDERVLGPNHPDTATGLNNLAHLLQAQGELAATRPLLERALAILERALGPDHPDTAASKRALERVRQSPAR